VELDHARGEYKRRQKRADSARRRVDNLEAQLLALGAITDEGHPLSRSVASTVDPPPKSERVDPVLILPVLADKHHPHPLTRTGGTYLARR
jgi:hypothetical protein